MSRNFRLMSEWWSYAPEDFLLFSPRVYWRMFELHNRSVWPMQCIAMLLGLAISISLLRPRPWSDRAIAAGLALAWAWVAWSFLWMRYATINWAILYVAPAFLLEAVLLVLVGAGGGLAFEVDRRVATGLGLALFLYALILHPLAPLVEGRSLQAAEVFAIAPDPTAIATLGLLSLASRPAAAWLGIVPAAWCLASWVTLRTMGSALAIIPLVAVCLAVIAFAIRLSGDRSKRVPGRKKS
jgi:Family of unknown function (DUF6064)